MAISKTKAQLIRDPTAPAPIKRGDLVEMLEGGYWSGKRFGVWFIVTNITHTKVTVRYSDSHVMQSTVIANLRRKFD